MADYNTVFNIVPNYDESNALLNEINTLELQLRNLRNIQYNIEREKQFRIIEEQRIPFPHEIINDNSLTSYLNKLTNKYGTCGISYNRFNSLYESIRNQTVKNILKKDNNITFSNGKLCKAIYSLNNNEWFLKNGGYH
jgi:redox-regulated HSP33 family molecular chaperone